MQLSRTIGVDRHIIECTIRAHLGITFRELQKKMRLKQALALLLEEQRDNSLKETAAIMGITPNALSRLIKSSTGYTATELRHHKW
jgi:methylphosphotriester-DNA--protein-cysteine methyltransferase